MHLILIISIVGITSGTGVTGILTKYAGYNYQGHTQRQGVTGTLETYAGYNYQAHNQWQRSYMRLREICCLQV